MAITIAGVGVIGVIFLALGCGGAATVESSQGGDYSDLAAYCDDTICRLNDDGWPVAKSEVDLFLDSAVQHCVDDSDELFAKIKAWKLEEPDFAMFLSYGADDCNVDKAEMRGKLLTVWANGEYEYDCYSVPWPIHFWFDEPNDISFARHNTDSRC